MKHTREAARQHVENTRKKGMPESSLKIDHQLTAELQEYRLFLSAARQFAKAHHTLPGTLMDERRTLILEFTEKEIA
jgi:hypothetical protein